jgi:predicted metal-binding membrane protein
MMSTKTEHRAETIARTPASGLTSDWAFVASTALLWLTTAGATIHWSGPMSQGMPMPGGWTLSMMWMSMPGQGRLGAAAWFMAMWIVMMVAMMLPGLMPALSGYRRDVGLRARGLGGLTTLTAAGYFSLWAAFGVGAYLIGLSVTGAAMRSPALARQAPLAIGIVVLLAGLLQFTPWKGRQLERCREGLACVGEPSRDGWSAYRQGIGFGVHCALCCSGFMLVLLVTGMMELLTTALLGLVITAERLAPRAEPATRAVGTVLVGAGILLLARAVAA